MEIAAAKAPEPNEIPREQLKILTFNHGQITSPVYGNTSNELSGQIPFLTLTADSKYSQGVLISECQEADIKSLAKNLLEESRMLWEEELDEDIMEKIRDTALMVVFVNPTHAVDSYEFRVILKLWLILAAMNDLLADDEMFDNVGTNFKDFDMNSKKVEMLREMGQSFRNESSESDDCAILIPKQKAILPFAKAYSNDLKQIPNYKTGSKAFKKECEKSFYKTITICQEAQGPDGFGLNFALTGTSCGIYLEFAAFLAGADISPEIRKTEAFKKLQYSFGEAAPSINTVFGLKEDIKLEKSKHSAILKLVGNGVTLQAAFDSYLDRLQNSFKAISEGAKILRASNPGNGNIDKFLGCMQDYLNGQLYWYAHRMGYTTKFVC